MPEEKDIQQIADEFVTALVNTIGEGTVQEVVEKNKDDALDITNIAAALPLKEMPPEVVKYLKELSQIVKNTSMDTRHDLNLAFPPSHFSGESNPLMLYYKAFHDTVLQSIVLFDDRLIISFNYRSQPVTIMLDQLIEFVNGDISDLKSSASP